MKTLLLVCCFFLVSCMKNPGDQKFVSIKEDQNVFPEVVSYGQGIYFFDSVGADFGNTLAAFLRKNSDLELGSMVIHTSANGSPMGYFVVFRPRKR